MARKELVSQIVKLYQKLGGNVSDVLGTKTNVSFIGKGEPEILKMDLLEARTKHKGLDNRSYLLAHKDLTQKIDLTIKEI